MKNIVTEQTNILGYTGIVRLSQYNDGKKTLITQKYNQGTSKLFDYLADCLIGDYDCANLKRPAKIKLLKISQDTQEIIEDRHLGFIYTRAKPEKISRSYPESDVPQSVALYSFIIPRDMLRSDITHVGLYLKPAEKSEDYAALCPISLSETELEISSVLVLDWELFISNQIKTKESTDGAEE